MVGDYWAMANQGAFLISGAGLVGAAKCGSFASKALHTVNAVQDTIGVGMAVQHAVNGEFGVGDALSLALTLAGAPRSQCFVAGTPVAVGWEEHRGALILGTVPVVDEAGDDPGRLAALGIGVALVGMSVGVRRDKRRAISGRAKSHEPFGLDTPTGEGVAMKPATTRTERAVALDECFRSGDVLGEERSVVARSEVDTPPSRLAMGIVRGFAACAMLLAGLGSLAYALTGSFGEVERPAVAATVPLYREVPAERMLKTRPIEVMRLGMRALGTNPDRSQVPEGLDEPNTATWRTVVLTMEKADGGLLAIELLRPVAWLLAQQAAAGSTIWLDIEEMAVRGPAQVLEIGPCPEIEPGTGNVVTGRFRHQSAEGSALLDIAFEGADGIEGVTPNHPFWSVDRQEFVRAEELAEGETVDTAHGRAAVANVAWRRAGPETSLYNLETHGEHVYRVGRDGVLVHNAGDQYIGRGGRQPRLRELAEDLSQPRYVRGWFRQEMN